MKLNTSLVMKTFPNHRGLIPRNVCSGPLGKHNLIRCPTIQYNVAHTKIGATIRQHVEAAYNPIDARPDSDATDTIRILKPKVESNAAMKRGIV